MPPLSLNEIQLKKIQKSESLKKAKDSLKNKSRTSKTTKKTASAKTDTAPWQKVNPEKSYTTEKNEGPSLEKIIDWGKKVKIYPEICIPVPDFLLKSEEN